MCFSPDGKMLASGNGVTIWLWNVASGDHLQTFRGHTFSVHGVGNVQSVDFSLDGKTLASGSSDGTILLWDVDFVEDNSIFAEEKTEFLNRESQIRQICEERGITTLCHFTRVENLQNILGKV